jgi:putative ABC transport system ATP-binding protein
MRGTSTPLLKACGLGRRGEDGGDWLLQGICIAICPGDRLAITGPSGSGKTLLLRAIALLDPPDAGVIEWKGRSPAGPSVPYYRRQVVYLHQRPSLFDGSIEANLRQPYWLKVNRRSSFDRNRILELLDVVARPSSFLERPSRDLSGGETQIVALLRALQLDPSVLLLDEPTTSLDEATSRAIEELIGRWLGEAPAERASIWVTHDSNQARRIADKCLRMQGGRLETK